MKNRLTKFFSKLFNPPPPDYRVVLALDYKGVKLYKFENPLNIPYARYVEIMQAVEAYSTVKISQGDFTTGLNSAKDFIKQGSAHEALQIIDLLLAYSEQEFNSSILFAMAAPLLLLEHENPEEPTIKHNREKLDLFQSDDHIRGFFLKTGFIYLMSYSNDSIGHTKIGDYLSDRQIKRTEKVFLKLITRNTLKVSRVTEMMKSTN